MTFKTILIRLGIGVALGGLGLLLGNYAGGLISETTLKESETFCKNADSIVALVDNSYSETTVKVMKGKTKMYSYKYVYKVQETSYEGSYTSNIKWENKPTVTVYYDKTNPSTSTPTDPCKTYVHYKTKEFSEYREYYYGASIVFILIGLGMAYANVVNLFKLLFNPPKVK